MAGWSEILGGEGSVYCCSQEREEKLCFHKSPTRLSSMRLVWGSICVVLAVSGAMCGGVYICGVELANAKTDGNSFPSSTPTKQRQSQAYSSNTNPSFSR